MSERHRLLVAASSLALSAIATTATAQVDPGAPQASVVQRGVVIPPSPSAGPTSSASEVVVTAQRLNAARASIEPSLGASTYTINSATIQAQPGGGNQQLNQVILQLPASCRTASASSTSATTTTASSTGLTG